MSPPSNADRFLVNNRKGDPRMTRLLGPTANKPEGFEQKIDRNFSLDNRKRILSSVGD